MPDETPYDHACREACKWCAENIGGGKRNGNALHIDRRLTRLPCTAPDRDEWDRKREAQIAELERHLRRAYQEYMDYDDRITLNEAMNKVTLSELIQGERKVRKEAEQERDRLSAELAQARQELSDAKVVIRELRSINVEPGISLGKAREWRQRVELLETALRGLHDDVAEYQQINNLGGYDNHWMITARAALAPDAAPGAVEP